MKQNALFVKSLFRRAKMGMIQYRKWDEGDIKNIIKLTDMYISDGFYIVKVRGRQ